MKPSTLKQNKSQIGLLFPVLLSGLLSNILLSNTALAQSSSSKYFIVQNVATEKSRVYERCTKYAGCPHKLVYEANILVGKNDNDTRTLLGAYKLSHWVKFYQDKNGKYPSWYDPNYPQIPGPGSSGSEWTNSSVMPYKGAAVRGAFGWYAGILEPNAAGQWMHGTIGWGYDTNEFLLKAQKGFIAFFMDLRSSGCSRHENRSIAYLQSLVPAGTPVFKVYARETLDDAGLSRYEDQKNPSVFRYLLTKNQVRAKNPDPIEMSFVLNKIDHGKLSDDSILEGGTYDVDRYPTVQPIDTSYSAKSGRSGDVYKIGAENFYGTFSVDTGLFANYRHPRGLGVGGYSGITLPEFMIVK